MQKKRLKEPQSVNTSEAGRVASLPVCTLLHSGCGSRELKEDSAGLVISHMGLFISPESLLLGE